MDNDQQEYEKFLHEQIKWCKKQGFILEEIEAKLYQMKELAEYVLENELNEVEINKLNDQLNDLKSEVLSLEQQLLSVFH